MRKSNGRRPVNKTDGPKKLGKRALIKSRRNDKKLIINEELEAAEEKGFQEALRWVGIKLLDGTEANRIRAEAVQMAKELRAELKTLKARKCPACTGTGNIHQNCVLR